MFPWLGGRCRVVLCSLFIIYCVVYGAVGVRPARAQELIRDQAGVIRSATLYGSLPNRTVRHYLGLEPAATEQAVVVTLTFYPPGISAPGLVNVLVLSDHGLRRHVAGASAEDAALFKGGAVPFDTVGNQRQISFTTAGRGNYTVVIYNKSERAIDYRVTVKGGLLVDDANQTRQFNNTETTESATPPATRSPIADDRLAGVIGAYPAQHFFGLQPSVRDSVVTVTLKPATHEALIFYVINEDGLRRVLHGTAPQNVSIATGFQPAYLARLQIAGRGPYTVVVANLSEGPVRYELAVEGGLLLDQSGQMQASDSQ